MAGIAGDGVVSAFDRARSQIRALLEGSEYRPGDRLPSERSLSEQLGIQRIIVRRAIDEFVESGSLERRGTSGTYLLAPVVKRPLLGNLNSRSLSEIVRASGGSPGSKLLFFETAKADRHVAERLEIAVGTPTFEIKRLRTIDTLPFCIETTVVPSSRAPDLAAGDLVGDGSLYRLLEERYGITVASSRAEIDVANPPPADAKFLGLRRGEAVLAINVVARDGDGVPIEFVTSLNHPQRVTLTTVSGAES